MKTSQPTKKPTSTTAALGHTQEELRALTGSLFKSQEEERRRIARELHDDVGQRLTAIEIDSDEAQRLIAGNGEVAAAQLREVRKQLSTLADDVRRMSHRLHPSILEDLGLAAALRSLIDDFDRGEKALIATLSLVDVPEGIPLDISTGVYRITQEALRNVVKHAGRTHVKVTLQGTDNSVLLLDVSDAGYGFDMNDSRSGLGLISMEERARLIGGTFRVQSELGHGTRISLRVPLPAAE